MRVKEKLKTFVPPSAHAFHNHVIASGSADQQILAQLENISAQLPEILAQLAAVSKQLAENFAQIQQESKHIVWEGIMRWFLAAFLRQYRIQILRKNT